MIYTFVLLGVFVPLWLSQHPAGVTPRDGALERAGSRLCRLAGWSCCRLLGQHLDKSEARRAEHLTLSVDYGNRSREALVETDRAEGARANFILNCCPRKNRYPQIRFNRALDRFDIIELHDVVNGRPGRSKYLIDSLASGDVAFEGNEALAVERGNVDPLAGGEFMVRAADQLEAVASKGNDLDLLASRRVGNYAEIDRPIDNVLVDLIWTAVLDVYVHLRIGLDELFHDVRKLVETN